MDRPRRRSPIRTALSATQLNATASVARSTFTYTPPLTTVLAVGTNQALTVHFTPTDTANYATPADRTVHIDVLKAHADDHLEQPRRHHLSGGAHRDAVERDRQRRRASFTYTPPLATVLNAGNNQTLTVHFVPTDTTNYATPADTTVQITVLKATPTITWSNPAAITYPDGAQRDPVERHRRRRGPLHLHAAADDGSQRRHRPDVVGPLRADRRDQLRDARRHDGRRSPC